MAKRRTVLSQDQHFGSGMVPLVVVAHERARHRLDDSLGEPPCEGGAWKSHRKQLDLLKNQRLMRRMIC